MAYTGKGSGSTVFLNGTGAYSTPAGGMGSIFVDTYQRDMSTANNSVNIAHGLGSTPSLLMVGATHATNAVHSTSYGSYNGTTQKCVIAVSSAASALNTVSGINVGGGGVSGSAYVTFSVTMDATNITLTFSKTSTPTGNLNISLTAFA